MSEVWRYRQLLLSLTGRDFRVRYRQSWLGVGWALLLPVAMLLVLTLVFSGTVAVTAPDGRRVPYALFAAAALVPWTYFSSSLSGCVNSLVANRNLVTKVYFPREVFPFSCVAGSLLDFAIAAVALLGVMGYYAIGGGWRFSPNAALLAAPLLVFLQTALTAGLGMLLAMANLFYRDVRHVTGVALQLLLFVSAVIVPLPSGNSALGRLMAWNPLVPLMNSYRACLLFGQVPDAADCAHVAVAAALALTIGWAVFRRASMRFAEYI